MVCGSYEQLARIFGNSCGGSGSNSCGSCSRGVLVAVMVVAIAVALAVLIIMPVLGIDVATITDHGRQFGRQHSCSCQHGSNNNNK